MARSYWSRVGKRYAHHLATRFYGGYWMNLDYMIARWQVLLRQAPCPGCLLEAFKNTRDDEDFHDSRGSVRQFQMELQWERYGRRYP